MSAAVTVETAGRLATLTVGLATYLLYVEDLEALSEALANWREERGQ